MVLSPFLPSSLPLPSLLPPLSPGWIGTAQPEQRLCFAERILVFCVSSAFKAVICFWCVQGAPSRRRCWCCAEASCIDRWHNCFIVGEWGHSHRVTHVGDLEAHQMTKPLRWIPGYCTSLSKGTSVWGWLVALKKWLQADHMPLGVRLYINKLWGCPGLGADFEEFLYLCSSHLFSLDANSLLNCHDCV